MRIPASKVYRAFPQLDRFSDEECERFVVRATQDYGSSRFPVLVLGAVALAACVASVVTVEVLVWKSLVSLITSNAGRHLAGDIAVVGNCVLVPLIFCVGMLMIRDRWLIKTITRRVHQTTCPTCGYSLLGLKIDHGVVTCPECAAPFFLADHGLTRADMIAKPVIR